MKLLNKEDNSLPHLIFLDINLPLKNGFECLKEIKEDDRLKNIAVVILSTSATAEIIDKIFLSKATVILLSPILSIS